MKKSRTFRLFKHSDTYLTFKAGETIFKEGDPGLSMYVVKAGRVELRIGSTVVDTVDAEGFLGEMALLDAETRSATAVAVLDSELVPLDREKFLYLVQETPDFALEVLRVMAQRLRRMDSDRKQAGS